MAGSSVGAPGASRLLDAVEYPTDQASLLARARNIGAPSAVVEAIRRLRPGAIRSHGELTAAVEALSDDVSLP